MKTLFFGFLLTLSSLSFSHFDEISKQIQNDELSYQTLQQFSNTVLYPHYYALWLQQNIENVDTSKVEAFRANPSNAAAYHFLAPHWHREVIRRKQPELMLSEFANATQPDQVCHYLAALEQQTLPIPAATVERLWSTGRSQPDHCDVFMIDWLMAQPDIDSRVWQRQLMAFYSRNGALLNYLNRLYVDDGARKQGEFLSQVYRSPLHLLSQGYNPDNEQHRQLGLATINRLAFQDPRAASNLWTQLLRATPKFSAKERQDTSKHLGITMAKQVLPEADYWLMMADPSGNDVDVQHWRLQIALAQDDSEKVKALYHQLSTTLQNRDQFQYWYGVTRLRETIGVEANNPLLALSNERSYYGFLAAGLLGKQPSLAIRNAYRVKDTQKISDELALQRANALFVANEIERAQVEWNLWIASKDADTRHKASKLALSWGWYEKAAQAAGQSLRYDLIDLRFPRAFNHWVDAQASKLEIPDYWIYGVMRQESRYMTAARSSAGALGLMQLMPATAAQTATRYKIPYRDTGDLSNPEINIALGSHYLAELLRRYDNPIYATAAYNAGPSRVNAWREQLPSDMTVWIESIPFDETRNYVKAVLTFAQVYALASDTPWQISQWTQHHTDFALNEE